VQEVNASAKGFMNLGSVVSTIGSPVYRFANNLAGGRFYTIYESEKNAVIQNYSWFKYDGIGFYAYPPQ
jgi:hypothetical protein